MKLARFAFHGFSVLLVVCATICAQNNVNDTSEARLIDSYGKTTVGEQRYFMDRFLEALAQSPHSKGLVVNYGKPNELRARERYLTWHFKYRRFDTSRIRIAVGGSVSAFRTDLWVVPAGAAPPKIEIEAYIESEFGRANQKSIERYLSEFYNALLNDKNSQGYIINYGTEKQIVQREKLIANSLRFRRFDPTRMTLVSGGSSENGVRTVMWIVPEGAEPPKP